MTSSYQFDLSGTAPRRRPQPGAIAIYGLYDPRFEDLLQSLRYVGRTVDPTQRLSQHLLKARLARYRAHVYAWMRALFKAGHERPVMRIIAWVEREHWRAAERACIAQARQDGCRLTNHTPGGDRGPDFWTPEQRAAMSARQKGRPGRPATTPRRTPHREYPGC